MKDVLCLAILASKVLCLVVFVTILKPHGITTVQAPSEPEYCRTEHSGAQGGGLNVIAEIPAANLGPCRVSHAAVGISP